MSKKFLLGFSFILCVAMLLTGCGGGGSSSGSSSSSSTGTVSGYVYVLPGTNKITANSNLILLSGSSTPPAGYVAYQNASINATTVNIQTTSDSSGHFVLTGLPAGACELQVTQSSYTTTMWATVTAGQTTSTFRTSQ